MTESTITLKIKITPNESDMLILNATMSAYKQACNFVSDYIFKSHDLKQASLNKNLYYPLKEKFGLRSQMAQSVMKTVIARYKTILENQKKWIKPEFKKPQYDLVWNRDYSLIADCFSVNTLDGRIKLPYHAEHFEKYFDKNIYKFGTAKLVYKHNKYFLHIPVTFEIPDMNISYISNVVGIDRGINFVVATYDSKHKSGFVSGKCIKQKRAHYSKLRKELQMRQTPSARRRLLSIGRRENRWMQDVNHCVSKALVDNSPKNTLFVLEDLSDVRSATERVRTKDRYVLVSWPFYDLEQKLKYKAAIVGDSVINVNPAYTSQTCPKCGHIEKSNRNKKLHIFCCKNCGYKSNDDRIGAMNLYRMGIEYLVELQTSTSDL
jgi:IS605 OrfB family transposase